MLGKIQIKGGSNLSTGGMKFSFKTASDAEIMKKVNITAEGLTLYRILTSEFIDTDDARRLNYSDPFLNLSLILNNSNDIAIANVPVDLSMFNIIVNWKNSGKTQFADYNSFSDNMLTINKPLVKNAQHNIIIEFDSKIKSLLTNRRIGNLLQSLTYNFYYEY